MSTTLYFKVCPKCAYTVPTANPALPRYPNPGRVQQDPTVTPQCPHCSTIMSGTTTVTGT